MKNICFTYITPFHPDRGGIGRVTHTLTKELQRRGYNVFYLIYPCSITVRHEYDYPAPLEYLPSSECLSQENIDAYFDYLKRNEIDVVINQSGNFSDSRLWCKAQELGVKVISVLHSNPWVAYKYLWDTDIVPLKSSGFKEQLKRVARILLYPRIKRGMRQSRIDQFKYLLPNTDIVCLLSKHFYPELSEICSGFETKYRAIPNPNAFCSDTVDFSHKKKTLLFVGLFSPPKKEECVLKLWKRIYRDFPDWNLVIVGDGPLNRVKRLKNLASKTERVSFVGLVPSYEYHRQSSILLMTSGYEGWGMVLTEAMQCGAVPIAFDSFASVRDIIEDGVDGFLVTPFDLDEYERKLRVIMSDDSKRSQMASSAMENVKRFDIEKVADQWVDVIDYV